jgi:hypothetical protein
MNGTRAVLIGAMTAMCSQTAFAQYGDFTQKVQLILDYLQEAGKGCINPAILGERPFKACREGTDSIALTIETALPVRDDDGRAIDTCFAKLTATKIPESQTVKMDVFTMDCPETTLKSRELAPIFVGIILELAEWVRRKEKPL